MHFLVIRKLLTHKFVFVFAIILLINFPVPAQQYKEFHQEITDAMLKATKYFDERVSVNGGYVWYYLPDLSRRWGEMEAYSSMVWVQGQGTVAMGNTFLSLFEATKNEYYYNLAEKSAYALIKGQLACGGWNYFIDFAGEESILNWYNTIGKNGWRLEEFQHYYGNATFDDAATPGAAIFLLRIYLARQNPKIKTALDRAINFILESQYSNGAWPQRFPFKDEFNKNGNPDYTMYYTFNDNVIWNNIKFLVLCYSTLYNNKFLDPIKRGMDFYLRSQLQNPQAGWSQQYSLDLKPASARTYEPTALDPQYTARHIEILIKFFEMTCDEKYLERIPDAIDWLESVKISSSNGIYLVPKLTELGTNKAMYIHRIGTNVNCGKYYYDYDSKNNLLHYQSIRSINMKMIVEKLKRIESMHEAACMTDTLIIPGLDNSKSSLKIFEAVDDYLSFPNENWNRREPNSELVETVLSRLDEEGRWLTTRAFISNPYIGEPECGDPNSKLYSHTWVGDQYDTSPYEDTSDQKYISTNTYMRNVKILMEFLDQSKTK